VHRAVGNRGAEYQGPPSVHGRVAVRTAPSPLEIIHTKYIPILTHTYQYAQIHTRPRSGKGPHLLPTPLAASTESPVRSPYRGLGCRRIRGSAGGPAPSGGANRPRPLGDRPRNHQSARWPPPWARTCPGSPARLLPTAGDMHPRPGRSPDRAGADVAARGLRRPRLVLVCIGMYWYVLVCIGHVSGRYCGMYCGTY